MVDERAPALARRLTAHGRVLRFFARLREGWVDEAGVAAKAAEAAPAAGEAAALAGARAAQEA
jgi:hypothetical protein